MERIVSNDPNVRWAHRTYRLHFCMWEYTGFIDVRVGGNVFWHEDEYLCDIALDRMDVIGETVFELTSPDGGTLQWKDDEGRRADALLDILVGIEIIKIEPYTPRETTKRTPNPEADDG